MVKHCLGMTATKVRFFPGAPEKFDIYRKRIYNIHIERGPDGKAADC